MSTNTKDPLLTSSPERQRELFEAFCKVAHGFSSEEVMGAAVNLFVNALRQAHPTQRMAVTRCDEIMVRAKELLATHYDALGKRRNVFPFHQVIQMSHFVDKDKG